MDMPLIDIRLFQILQMCLAPSSQVIGVATKKCLEELFYGLDAPGARVLSENPQKTTPSEIQRVNEMLEFNNCLL